ncbi:MAG: Na-translocating system protein MpsC family protein [Solirubrobacterales bacterium]
MEEIRHEATQGEVLAQISTGLVQLHSRYYGKGPTKAKTHMVNDTVISILRGGFTTVERTMIDQGRLAAVHEMRRTFQEVMEEQFTGVVQEATGRTVIAYMSQVHTNPDLAVEIFVLEPSGEEPTAQVGLEDLPEVG